MVCDEVLFSYMLHVEGAGNY